MADFVEREAVIDELDEWKELYQDSGAACVVLVLAKRAIRKLPAADVRPVVLCRDCKHYELDNGWCEYFGTDRVFEDFCSEGEKMEER